jgi:hypothetical protein
MSASPRDSLTVLREVSEEYERRKSAADAAARERKAAAVAAASEHTYAALAEAAGVSVGHAHVLVNGRAA